MLMSHNVRDGRSVHFFMGGPEYQIEHHVFPTAPRPNLRKRQLSPAKGRYTSDVGSAEGLRLSLGDYLYNLSYSSIPSPFSSARSSPNRCA